MKTLLATTAIIVAASSAMADWRTSIGACYQDGAYVGSIYDCRIADGLSADDALAAVDAHLVAMKSVDSNDNKQITAQDVLDAAESLGIELTEESAEVIADAVQDGVVTEDEQEEVNEAVTEDNQNNDDIDNLGESDVPA